MDQHRAGVQHSGVIEQGDRRHPVALEGHLALVTSLRHVDVEAGVELLGQRGAGLDHLDARPVDGMRGGLDEGSRVPTDGRVELVCVSHRDVGRLEIPAGRARPVVHGTRQDDPDTHLACGLDHGEVVLVPAIVQVEEVDDGGDAGPRHLREVEQRPGADGLGVKALREWIQDAVAPPDEGPIVTEAPQQRLEGMSVAVDASGQDRDVAPVLAFVVGESFSEVRRLARGQDTSPLHHEAVPAVPAVVGEDEFGGDEGHGVVYISRPHAVPDRNEPGWQSRA